MGSDHESPVAHPAEFADWRALSKPGEQSAAEELLAEHHLKAAVNAAMVAECSRMERGDELRPLFWRDVVEFLGEFAHACHRRKEERVFYPAVERAGLIAADRVGALQKEHGDAKELIESIIEGVHGGDWEQVERVVTLYVHFMRHHMKSEEIELVERSVRELDDVVHDEIVEGFHAIETAALSCGRQHFLDLADRIRAATGLSSV